MLNIFKKLFGSAQDRLLKKYWKIVAKVNEWEEKFKSLSDDELRRKTDEFRERISKGETLESILPEAYAVVKNVCRRMVGTPIHVSGYDQQWDMIPFDVQVLGAIAMHHGAIAEMGTGEGKTITAVLPLYLNALTGKPVHLVTVNDYLALRDCQWVGTILRWLGLTTGALTNDVPMEDRKKIYACDVVYGTASEFGFDYLRDNSMVSKKEDQCQRGFYFSIIDEVDSILIDEARTPLIISGPVPVSRQLYDELKHGVSDLVRKQRDLCNRLATEGRKTLDKFEGLEKKTKAQEEEEKDALHKLWMVSKGTPHNKILLRVKEDPDMRAALDKWDLYYYSQENKEEKQKVLSYLFMTVDEKSNEFELTDKGSTAWHENGEGVGKADDFVMLDISHEYMEIDNDPDLTEDEKVQRKLTVQNEDAKRKERAHNLRQLLRAHLLMEKDVDYMIHDGKIVIIDEHTGRPQPGRRFSDGLHQAIEAKEGLEIQKETQTYATITLQNFFRMYKKLSGMTGTATTEANEFKEIYKLEVLEIPTHKKCIRKDANDEIYMTEREKYNAIIKEIKEVHEKGRPILLGTESVEVSEKLSRICRQNKLEHTVLNAKQHAKEAEVIAHAGRRGSITISTNMAGRGTDIKLEKGVAELGGLHVIGTTRHQSRRIDRQLRGRCARQGDPGTSKFFVSFEDSLLRLFASPALTKMLQRFRPPEGEPISSPILNRSIETAQKRVEQRNYTIRKHTLEYDDVMNKQRQEIYAFRNEVLHTTEIGSLASDLLRAVCSMAADKFFRSHTEEGGWDPEGYRRWIQEHFPISIPEGFFDQDHLEVPEIERMASEKIIQAFQDKMERENKKIPPERLVEKPGRQSPAEEAVRSLMIRKVDHLWQEHLLTMDYLRTEVTLRSVGQRDPLLEFKHESFKLFEEFSHNLNTEIAQDLFRFEIVTYEPGQLQRMLSQMQMETQRSFMQDMQENPEQQGRANRPNPNPEQASAELAPQEKLTPIIAESRSGRNETCPCGSGKKYKKCCGWVTT